MIKVQKFLSKSCTVQQLVPQLHKKYFQILRQNARVTFPAIMICWQVSTDRWFSHHSKRNDRPSGSAKLKGNQIQLKTLLTAAIFNESWWEYFKSGISFGNISSFLGQLKTDTILSEKCRQDTVNQIPNYHPGIHEKRWLRQSLMATLWYKVTQYLTYRMQINSMC